MPENLFSDAIRLLLGDSEDPSLVDPDDLPPQDLGMMTDPPKRSFVSFGEPVVSYEQVGESFDDSDVVVRRRILCPELELASALAVLGNFCEFFTVIPSGYYGDLVQVIAKESGVYLFSLSGEPGSHIADLSNLNGRKIHQRLLSAFNCAQNVFRWERGILGDRVPCWAHTCMSSFVWSDNALESWKKFMESALNPKRTVLGDLLVSLELRTKDCDVPFQELWNFLSPFLKKLYLLIFSPEEALACGELLGLPTQALKNKDLEGFEPAWTSFANQLRAKIGSHFLIIMFESDDASSRVVISAGGSATCSPSMIASPSALLGKVVHRLMHAPRPFNVSVESVVGTMTSSPTMEPNRVIAEMDRDTLVKEAIPEDSW
jgi:hypothetical protein